MAYYLADDSDNSVVLTCKTKILHDHLLNNGCHIITRQEFELRETENYQGAALQRATNEKLALLLQRS